jgi:hypothetical protein
MSVATRENFLRSGFNNLFISFLLKKDRKKKKGRKNKTKSTP